MVLAPRYFDSTIGGEIGSRWHNQYKWAVRLQCGLVGWDDTQVRCSFITRRVGSDDDAAANDDSNNNNKINNDYSCCCRSCFVTFVVSNIVIFETDVVIIFLIFTFFFFNLLLLLLFIFFYFLFFIIFIIIIIIINFFFLGGGGLWHSLCCFVSFFSSFVVRVICVFACVCFIRFSCAEVSLIFSQQFWQRMRLIAGIFPRCRYDTFVRNKVILKGFPVKQLIPAGTKLGTETIYIWLFTGCGHTNHN